MFPRIVNNNKTYYRCETVGWRLEFEHFSIVNYFRPQSVHRIHIVCLIVSTLDVVSTRMYVRPRIKRRACNGRKHWNAVMHAFVRS